MILNHNKISCIKLVHLLYLLVSKGVSSCKTQFITHVINCVAHDGTPLDSFIDLSTTGMCHLNIISASQAPIHKFTWQKQHSTRRRLF